MKGSMKLWSACLLSAVALFACMSGTPAQAFTVTITVDENGNGSFVNSTGFSSSLSSSMQLDPGPGGLTALTYDLLNPPGLVAGDLVLNDPDSTTSDVIRFNPQEQSPSGGIGSLVFYSNTIPAGSLADIGFPGGLYTNIVTLPEIGAGAIYTPVAGQPGFVAGAGGPVTYVIISDESVPVPEPASLFLFAAGIVGLGLMRRRKIAA